MNFNNRASHHMQMRNSYKETEQRTVSFQTVEKMISDATYRLLTFWALAFVMITVTAQDYDFDENVKELLARRKNMEYMRHLIEDENHRLNKIQKKTCNLNGGMSAGCDYRAIDTQVSNDMAFSSLDGVGKRKRFSETEDENMRAFLRSMKVLAGNRKRR